MPLKSMQSNSLTSDPIIDEQIDQALYQIDHLISSLKDKAYTINDQLVGQADTINHIHECMEESTHHIQQQNIDMKKIGLIN
jgi:Mg2+ and Co2+ transporter CorA